MILITVINQDLYALIPIIYEFKNQTTQHILIYDDKEMANCQKLESYLKSIEQRVVTLEVDEDTKEDMLKIQTYLDTFETEKLYLNATESDISLIVVISGFILNHGGKVLAYDKFENSYNIIDTKGFSNHKIQNSMNIDDFILSLDYKIIKEVDTREILKQKKELNLLFGDFNIMFRITNFLRRNKLHEIKHSYPNHIIALKKLDVIDSQNRLLKDTSYFGKLFEDFIYLNVIKYDFDDIKVGVEIVFDTHDDEMVKNEFDILAIKDNHIYTIECKLGDNLNAQDVIYKSDSLLGYFGDDSKNMIINIHPDSINKPHKPNYSFTKNAKLRAVTNNVDIYNSYNFGTKKFCMKIINFFGVQKRVFLLGGYDLEMISIKKILDKHNQDYHDNRLSWGAKLSTYKERFKNNYYFIGIELIEDVELPTRYTSIDHHNELQNRKSSIEQVADILKITLNKKEMLIAKNDTGYIPAMLKFGATKEEIDSIRVADRKAQGVTKKDEKLALKSLENSTSEDGILLVEALTDKFSSICDNVYGKDMLIYSDTKLSYYGRDTAELVERYKQLIDEKKAYYGANFGFFGITEDIFSAKEIEGLRDEILGILKKK